MVLKKNNLQANKGFYRKQEDYHKDDKFEYTKKKEVCIMKNLNKIITTIVVIALTLTLAMPVTAEAATKKAPKLNKSKVTLGDRRPAPGTPPHRVGVQAGAGSAGTLRHQGKKLFPGADGPLALGAQGPVVRWGGAEYLGAGHGLSAVHRAVPAQRIPRHGAGTNHLLRQSTGCRDLRQPQVRHLPDPPRGRSDEEFHGGVDDPEFGP